MIFWPKFAPSMANRTFNPCYATYYVNADLFFYSQSISNERSNERKAHFLPDCLLSTFT